MVIENGTMLSTKAERAEVDTALPFESVKAAVSLFGSQIGAKKTSFLEKRAAQEAELLHAQDELLRVKELLKIAQEEKEEALQELAEAKLAFHQTSESLKVVNISKASAKQDIGLELYYAQACGQVFSNSEDKYVEWESKLRCASEKHAAAVLEMESSKQQLADLKQELLASSNEQEVVFQQTEATLVAMEGNMKGADYVGTDLAGVNNWLVVLKHACSSDATKGSPKVTVGDTVNQGRDMGNELELKLLSMMNASIRVRGELKHVKDDEEKGIAAALELLAFVEAMRLELGRAAETGEGLKEERSCNRASVLSILESLKVQAESLQRQIGALAGREALAAEKAMALGTELAGVRAEFEGAKAEARESTLKLLQALKAAEADIAKWRAEAEALREEVTRTRSRSATIEAKSIVSISQLSQALKQAEADMTEARGEVQALREKVLSHAVAEAAAKESNAQLSQTLQKAQADVLEADHTTQVLQEEVSEAKARSAADAESIAQTSQAFKQTQEELNSVRAEREALQKEVLRLESCIEAAEVKAKESISQLTKALEQATEEVAHAKTEMEALREEMLRGKATVVKQVTFLMPNDEVRTPEDSKTDGNPAKPVRENGGVGAPSIPARASEAAETDRESIPIDQPYESLKKKLQDAVRKADGPSAAKTSKKDVPQDLESMRTALKQALHRAEMAEAGKTSVESELRRLREREQRRRERSTAFTTQHNLSKAIDVKDGADAKPQSEPLGNVLNINISAERTKTLVRIGSRRLKKTNTSSYTSTYFASKKAEA